MSVPIIHVLEIVKVDKKHTKAATKTTRSADLFLEYFFHVAGVVKTSQIVAVELRLSVIESARPHRGILQLTTEKIDNRLSYIALRGWHRVHTNNQKPAMNLG